MNKKKKFGTLNKKESYPAYQTEEKIYKNKKKY
nr:MAG TPA: hypothetical protein [Caudoviricetes sp.]